MADKLEYIEIYNALSLVERVMRQTPMYDGLKERSPEFKSGFYAGIHTAANIMLKDISDLVLDYVPEADGGKEDDF